MRVRDVAPKARQFAPNGHARTKFVVTSSALFAALVAVAALPAGAADGLARRELTKVGRPVSVLNLTVIDPATGELKTQL